MSNIWDPNYDWSQDSGVLRPDWNEQAPGVLRPADTFGINDPAEYKKVVSPESPDKYAERYKKLIGALGDVMAGGYRAPGGGGMPRMGGGGSATDRGLAMLSQPVSTDWGQGQSSQTSRDISGVVVNQLLKSGSI